MQTIELGADKRDIATKGTLRTLRVGGKIPAVVYGGKKEPANLIIEGKKLIQVLKGHGMNVLVNLKVGAGAEVVLLKDLQRDVLTHDIIHVDFQRISMTEKLDVNVPIHIKGEAPGVKVGGGIMEHILRDVRVRCLPTDIPDGIDLDVSALQLNQGLKVKDIVRPNGVEILNEGDALVVNIVAPAAEEVATPATAAAGPAEPEVIAKGKKPEEGEEGAAAPAAGAKAPAAGAAKAPAAPAAKK
jgi:large subunit ribosomal protein L25